MNWPHLPELTLIRVLGYLPVRDQLNVRLVCKHWKLINDNSVRRNELILFLEIYPRPLYWFHNGSEVDLGNAFLVSDLRSMKGEFFLRHFRKVRRLMIAHTMNTPSEKFVKQIQASFPELEHLQFNSLGHKCCYSGLRTLVYETDLNLANLQTFYSQAGDMPLGLHCPRLTELYVYSHLNINETDEQTKLCIQNLRFLLVQKLTYPPNFEFSNLEVFYFNNPSPPISLGDFPRLKELHCFDAVSKVYDGLKDLLENLLEQKRSLKRDELRVYFDGFELKDDLEPLNAYLEPNVPFCRLNLNENVLRIIINEKPLCLKLDLLSKNLFMSDHLDDQLVELQEGNALVESMFRSAKCIRFEQPLSKASLNLFELSDRFRYIFSFWITIEPSQSLLDRLPDALPHLLDFSYFPKFFKNHLLNFKFLGRFKSLKNFYVYQRLISIDEVRFIVNKCKFISFLCFDRPNNVRVRMLRAIGQKVFEADWASSDAVAFAYATFTVEEMLDYLEASRWLEKNDFLGERQEVDRRNYLHLRADWND